MIFIWPWNENTRTKQEQQTNGNRAIWLVHLMDTIACGFWLVIKENVGSKNFMPEKFLEISWYYFDVILQNGWPIELLHIRVFFGRKKKSPCFDLFIRWLIKQITNTCWNHFPRSFKNPSIRRYSRTSCKRPPKMKGLEIAHGRRLLTIVRPQGKIFKST